jgi:hypothetical protein
VTTWRRGLVVVGTTLVLFGCSPASDSSDTRTPAPSAPESTVAEAPATTETEPAAGEDTSAALDAFVAEQQAYVPAILETNPGMYSDATITAIHPGTVEFSYTYAEALDPVAAAAGFEAMIPTLQTLCDTQVFGAMQAAGITDPSAVYTYLNPDGSTIWTHTFTMS